MAKREQIREACSRTKDSNTANRLETNFERKKRTGEKGDRTCQGNSTQSNEDVVRVFALWYWKYEVAFQLAESRRACNELSLVETCVRLWLKDLRLVTSIAAELLGSLYSTLV